MDLQKVHPDSVIADVLSQWPETVGVFMDHRMACIGCSMSSFMTLEDAINIYGLNSDSFLNELKGAIQLKEVLDKYSTSGDNTSQVLPTGNKSGREQ